VARISTAAGVLQKNEEAALANRELFAAGRLLVLNLMSAPGAGKTSVLEVTIRRLAGSLRAGVIEGDLQTTYDADRISALGVPAHQINTITSCHLDARMVRRALDEFTVDGLDVLFIENVGNMICPAAFDLGEHQRVVVYSVAEGADKPKKYPVIFHRAGVVLINKIDLLPYTGVDLDELRGNVLEVNPEAAVIPLSCRTGEGFDAWLTWLRQAAAAHNAGVAAAS